MTRKQMILIAAGVVVFAVVGFFGWQGAQAWLAWNRIERVQLDTAEARNRLAEAEGSDAGTSPAATYDDTTYDAVLVIGSDDRGDNLWSEQEGAYADAVLLWFASWDGGDPLIVSFPRDMLVLDPCTGEETKLDRALERCGDEISGPERVAPAVEDHTGIGVDHFALFGFDAFVDVIDSLGGVEICVEHALREGGQDIVPAGCSIADGTTALRWVRSRGTQEFADGE